MIPTVSIYAAQSPAFDSGRSPRYQATFVTFFLAMTIYKNQVYKVLVLCKHESYKNGKVC